MESPETPAFAYQAGHEEVAAALEAIGDPKLGEAIRADRKSELQYLGVRFPALRARVKQGFTFTDRPADEVLVVWDDLWRNSPWGDLLFAALEHYVPIVSKPKKDLLGAGAHWQVMRQWIGRVDNWCHCDQLSRVYSHLLEREMDLIYPQMAEWNGQEALWPRRASLVSLVHYSGKNSVFLPPSKVLPLVENCVADHRHYIQTAVGWVLREMSVPYPDEVRSFLDAHGSGMTGAARKRASERLGN